MKITFIGTGLMGAPMVTKLIEAGYEVCVYNRTTEKAEKLRNVGAIPKSTFLEVVSFSETIIFMLSDYKAIYSLLNSCGSGELKGKSIIQMSTIAPAESLLLKKFCEENDCDYSEAPVLGSLIQIQEKKLIVLFGGSKSKLDLFTPIFQSFSDKIEFIGEVGKASALKLALNQLIVGLTSVFSMSLSYVRKSGLHTDQFMDIVRNSALYAPTFDKKLQNFLSGDYSSPNFPLKHLLKDIGLITEAFTEKEVNSFILEAMQKILAKGVEENLGELDYSALYKVIDAG